MALASRARVRNHGDMQPDSPKGPVERALMVLEVVAERGGASAKEIAHSLDLPLHDRVIGVKLAALSRAEKVVAANSGAVERASAPPSAAGASGSGTRTQI